MFHTVSFSVVLLLIAVATPIPTNPNDVDPVVIVDFNTEMEDTSEGLLELFSSSKLTAVPAAQIEGTLRYSIGRRVSNDRLVSQNTDNHRWSTPQNVTLLLQYPSSGRGAILTYLEVVVDQSSNIGHARVAAGGIGKRNILIVIEGNSTYWFNYSSKIYGI